MKQIKRKLAWLLALVMVISLLGACGKKEEKLEDVRQETAAEWPKINPNKLENDLLAGDWESETALLSFDGEEYFWYTDDKTSMEGRYQFDGLDLYLKDRAGTVYLGCMDREGNLKLDDFRGSFLPSWAAVNQDLAGLWTYQSGDITLTFAEDGTFQWTHQSDAGEGNYVYDGSDLVLLDGDEVTRSGYVDSENRLYLENLVGFFYAEGEPSYYPLMEEDQDLLAPKLEPVLTRNPLDNGAVFIQESKGSYIPAYSEWAVGQQDVPYDVPGMRAVSVMGACYIPYRTMPAISGEALIQCYYLLYDRYTGLSFPRVEAQQGEDGGYYYAFDSRDGRVEMAVYVDIDATGPYGDCANILTIDLTVVIPEWYDGLTFMALPVPETMEAMEEENGRDRVPYVSNILDFSHDRLASGLSFSVG